LGQFAVGEKGAGQARANVKGARASLLRSQGRRSSQRKASWVRVSCGANPIMVSLGPGKTGLSGSSEERSTLPRKATEDVRGLVRPVRLPQPMGAGGQQPLRSQPLPRGADSTLHRPGRGQSYHGENPCYLERQWSAARTADPASRNRPRTIDATEAPRAPRGGLASAERPSRERVNLDAPASK